MRLICAPAKSLPQRSSKDTLCISLYAGKVDRYVGATLLDQIRKEGLAPTVKATDFLSLAMSILAADYSVPRASSPDGWTRQLDVTVAVHEPDTWQPVAGDINQMLAFLTGDIWHASFVDGGLTIPPPKQIEIPSVESVCLLSGGMDSLVGAIDLAGAGQQAVLVSQVSTGDKTNQKDFAALANFRHYQFSHRVRATGSVENSQRARSIGFMAYALLVASSTRAHAEGKTVRLVIPENGFISLNVPLTPLRFGSLSTRTTHPHFIKGLQSILDRLDFRVRLENPYQFKTKGEMLKGCVSQTMLQANAYRSTSCGRFARNAFHHCGRCVPCLIRRAAFHAWGQADQSQYVFDNLALDDDRHRGFDDVRAACLAVERYSAEGIQRFVGASLNSHQLGDLIPYRGLVERSLRELEAYLHSVGVL